MVLVKINLYKSKNLIFVFATTFWENIVSQIVIKFVRYVQDGLPF